MPAISENELLPMPSATALAMDLAGFAMVARTNCRHFGSKFVQTVANRISMFGIEGAIVVVIGTDPIQLHIVVALHCIVRMVFFNHTHDTEGISRYGSGARLQLSICWTSSTSRRFG